MDVASGRLPGNGSVKIGEALVAKVFWASFSAVGDKLFAVVSKVVGMGMAGATTPGSEGFAPGLLTDPEFLGFPLPEVAGFAV